MLENINTYLLLSKIYESINISTNIACSRQYSMLAIWFGICLPGTGKCYNNSATVTQGGKSYTVSLDVHN